MQWKHQVLRQDAGEISPGKGRDRGKEGGGECVGFIMGGGGCRKGFGFQS